MRAMCSAFPTWADPWNMMCSKRWAKPVLPGGSCLEPTPYQRFTATTGATWSGTRLTRNPLSRRRGRISIRGTTIGRPIVRPLDGHHGRFCPPGLEGTDVGQLSRDLRIEGLGRRHRRLQGGEAEDPLPNGDVTDFGGVPYRARAGGRGVHHQADPTGADEVEDWLSFPSVAPQLGHREGRVAGGGEGGPGPRRCRQGVSGPHQGGGKAR